jgi:hypothetical protein
MPSAAPYFHLCRFKLAALTFPTKAPIFLKRALSLQNFFVEGNVVKNGRVKRMDDNDKSEVQEEVR